MKKLGLNNVISKFRSVSEDDTEELASHHAHLIKHSLKDKQRLVCLESNGSLNGKTTYASGILNAFNDLNIAHDNSLFLHPELKERPAYIEGYSDSFGFFVHFDVIGLKCSPVLERLMRPAGDFYRDLITAARGENNFILAENGRRIDLGFDENFDYKVTLGYEGAFRFNNGKPAVRTFEIQVPLDVVGRPEYEGFLEQADHLRCD